MRFADSQAASTIQLEDGTVLSKCDQCRGMWKERNDRGVSGEPPCDGCRVDLLPVNAEAARVFQMCRRQVITFFNGEVDREIDLNYVAVSAVMDLYGVKDRRECFEKVVRTYRYFLNERDKDA